MSRRRSLLGLALVSGLLALGTLPSVPAQAQDAAPTGDTLFGSYTLEARGIGVEGIYNVEGIIPGGTPILDFTLPETLARFGSGPTGYGLASLAYPGGLLVNLDALVAQSGGKEGTVPPYPIKAEAFYPSDTPEVDKSQPGGTVQKVTIGDLGVLANGTFPGGAGNPAISAGSITSASRTSIEGGKAVSRARVVMGDVVILGGVITIDSIVTDLVAAHNGTDGVAQGGTTASGVKFLGLAASFTNQGLVLDEAPATPDGPAGPLGSVLSPVSGPLKDATKPVQDAIAKVLQQATPQVDDLLAQAGVTMSIAKASDVDVESGATSRASNGVSLTFKYSGRNQKELGQLIDSIPAALKPNVGPIPNPVTFLAENHITALNIAPASVSALASPPFDVGDLSTSPASENPIVPGVIDPGFTTGGDGGSLAEPDFASPVPELQSGANLPTEPISNAATAALPGILVAIGLAAAWLFGIGSTKLADNVLAPVSRSCPTGQDQPLPPRSP